MLIQFVTFKLLWVSNLTARLPFVLLGMLGLWVTYLLARYLWPKDIPDHDKWVGLLAMSLMAVASYPIWLSRTGYLDGFLVPIVGLTLLLFLKTRTNNRMWLWLGAVCGAGLLVKYSFLFIFPALIITLLVTRRQAFLERELYKGLLVMLLIISPVIIYNYQVYQTRGHFDAALSTLVGLQPEDYKGLSRVKVFVPLAIARDLATGGTFSPIVLALALIGLSSLYLKNKEAKSYEELILITATLVMALLELSVLGSVAWVGAILVGPIYTLAGLGLYTLYKIISIRKLVLAKVLVGAVLIIEMFIAIQSQLLPRPIIDKPILLSEYRANWEGYSELEDFLTWFYQQFPAISHTLTYRNIPQLGEYQQRTSVKAIAKNVDLEQRKQVIIYDNRMNWFAALWLFERRRLYERETILSLSEALMTIREYGEDYYLKSGFSQAIFIITTPITRESHNIQSTQQVLELVTNIEQALQPSAEIINKRDEVAFVVYTLNLK